jgi:hypothetical protein
VTTTDLQALVAAKLAAYEGEYFLFAQYARFPRVDPPFAAYREQVIAEMSRRLGATLMAQRTPPDPELISIKSWQFGFTDAQGDEGAARGFRDGVFLKLQNYCGDYLASRRWRDCLAAFDRPERWIEVGRGLEEEGWIVDANACFAAARWLDPASEPAIAASVAGRDASLPRRLLVQPDPEYPGLKFSDRHWRAWDMKNYGRLDVPTLLRWECDRNFSVRARIYRSLGQRPHPAAIQALHEGTHDPHPFARAQAVRSLGWCADPNAVARLEALAREDPHPEVRRVAAKAAQRIAGFWRFYGEWNAIAGSKARVLAVARELADVGLRIFAWEVTVEFGDAGSGDHPEIDALCELLEGDLPREGFNSSESSYSHWFAEAREVELMGEPVMTIEEAIGAAVETGARGFEARRVVRKLGGGVETSGAPVRRAPRTGSAVGC